MPTRYQKGGEFMRLLHQDSSYEKVLGDIACYIAAKCDLTPSEAVGLVINDDRTDAVVEQIKMNTSGIDTQAYANLYLDDTL